MPETVRDRIRVLHVDDEPAFTDLTADYIEANTRRVSVETATSPVEGLELIDQNPPDCVVSDYDMSGMDGLELLQTVRETHPDLPFILFTDSGSEAIASDAVSAGVTDYLQKTGGTEQYELLLNRVQNAVEARRNAHRATRQEKLVRLTEFAADTGGLEVDVETRTALLTDGARRLTGLTDRDQVSFDDVLELFPPDDRTELNSAFERSVETSDQTRGTWQCHPLNGAERVVEVTFTPDDRDEPTTTVRGVIRDVTEENERQQELRSIKNQYQTLVNHFPNGGVFLFDSEYRYVRAGGEELREVGLSGTEVEGATPWDLFPDEIADETVRHYEAALNGEKHTYEAEYEGETYWVQTAPVRTSDSTDPEYGITVSQNITNQVERRQELKRQNERLDEFVSVVSHDLRNPINVAGTHLELAGESPDGEHLSKAADAIDRSQALIDDLLMLARENRETNELAPVELDAVAERSWQTAATDDATVTVDVSMTIEADRGLLQQLLENLYRNAVEHGGADVTVTVGDVEGGFYVADTGPGIDESEREDVFDAGYSTAADGTGFGLRIAEQIVEAHGWEISVTDSDDGGARFEVTDVETVG